MTEILQIFSGNPLTTFIGKKIEAATRPDLDSDDWALNLEICDIINENDDDAKDAVKAIRKRLQQIEQDRNFLVTNRCLTVLETCVNNCSHRFHVLVMTKDFIQDLVKLIGPKNNPPIDLQERVLGLIERWADAFKTQPDLTGVVSVYIDLKAKGVTFPQQDPTSAPIQTPQRSVPMTPPPLSVSPAGLGQHMPAGRMVMVGQQQPIGPVPMHQSGAYPPEGPILLEGEGYNKISQDLTVVQTSIEMFNEIMRILETDSGEADWSLAADLDVTCHKMKDRIVDLIERVANEDLTIELLRLNDDLNNVFVKYNRLVKNRDKAAASKQPQTEVSAGESSTSTSSRLPATTQASTSGEIARGSHAENEPSLIDFGAFEDSPAATAASTGHKHTSAGAGVSPKPVVVDPFDSSLVEATLARVNASAKSAAKHEVPVAAMSALNLASLASVSGDSQGSSSQKKTAAGNNFPDELASVREQDFAEIENWLSSDTGRDLTSIRNDMPSLDPISVPNSEFENFIASRALAGQSEPQTGATTPLKNSSDNPKSARPEPSV